MKVPIKKYVDDPSLPWEERYNRLMDHHIEETTFLFNKIKEMESDRKIEWPYSLRKELYMLGWKMRYNNPMGPFFKHGYKDIRRQRFLKLRPPEDGDIHSMAARIDAEHKDEKEA